MSSADPLHGGSEESGAPRDLPPLVEDHARAAQGDSRAAERVVGALYPRVRSRVQRRLARYPDDVIADAVQEAMSRILIYLPGCRAVTDQQLLSWALLVGWHAALRYVRSPAAGMAIAWNAIPLDTLVDDAAIATPPTAVGEVVSVLKDGRDEHTPAGGAAGPGDEDGSRGSWACGELALITHLLHEWRALIDVKTESGLPPNGGNAPPLLTVDLLRALLAEAVVGEDPDNVNILWQRAGLGRSYHDIGAARSISPGAAKRRYQRTVARLRRAVAARAAELPEPLRTAALRHIDGGVRFTEMM